MKLKTLKDLQHYTVWNNDIEKCKENEDIWISDEELRAEAVKWAKQLIKEGEGSGTAKEDIYLQGKLDMLQEFFNLKEGDLE